ncbi:MAG: glycosyltransferase family 4 protein [Phycisphaerales bacterium]|nr:glycosyltransferase family 4 protein [Phycisphaerales bacterium]
MSYYFPPDGGAGAQRPWKFSKYLPATGIDVGVITHGLLGDFNWTRPPDSSLAAELDSAIGCEVVRVPAAEGVAGLIDGLEGWSVATADAVCELIDAGRADAVVYTMSPFSLVRSAAIVRERRPGTPIVLDLRDPWALDGWQPHKTKWHWRRQFQEMKAALEAADGVIANTPECGRLFVEHFPGLDPERLTVIPNGYDAADFEGDPGEPSLWDPGEEGVLRIVHSGTLCTLVQSWYAGVRGAVKRLVGYSPERIDYSGRTLVHVLEAVRRLRETGDPLGGRVRIEVIGTATDADKASVASSGAGDAVRFHGYVPHTEAVRHIRLAEALLLPLHGLAKGERSRIVPGKTYEYLATGRPILGLLPEGDARELVERSGVGVVAEPCDPGDIVRGLRELEGVVGRSVGRRAPEAWVGEFERRALTERLAGFVERVVSRAGAPAGSG